MADLIPLQRNEKWLNEDLTPTQRFAELIENLSTEANVVINSGDITDTGESNAANVRAAEANRRIDDLIVSATAPLLAKIKELEGNIATLEALLTLPKQKAAADTSQMGIIKPMQTQPEPIPVFFGDLVKRIEFLEGNL